MNDCTVAGTKKEAVIMYSLFFKYAGKRVLIANKASMVLSEPEPCSVTAC